MFFDSLRNFGNLGLVRQLWGTAIDIRRDGQYTTDVSHPPFYVESQEFGTENHRAFAALEVCKPNGLACSTGIDCCQGFCSESSAAGSAEPLGTCSAPPANDCANVDLVPVFEGHMDCYASDGLHPNPTGSAAMAKVVYAKLKEQCVAQPASSGCCEP